MPVSVHVYVTLPNIKKYQHLIHQHMAIDTDIQQTTPVKQQHSYTFGGCFFCNVSVPFLAFLYGWQH